MIVYIAGPMTGLPESYCEVIARRLSQGVLDFGGEAS